MGMINTNRDSESFWGGRRKNNANGEKLSLHL